MTCSGCKQPVTVGPGPYYNQVSREVVENHQLVVASLAHAAGVIVPESFVIPAIDEGVDITLPNITYVPVGMYLYSPQYGYFKITMWNPQNCSVQIVNEGITGTQGPGTFVNENTIFAIVARPCCEDNQFDLLPFVAEDFIAQDVGQSLTIDVTSSFGLRIGDNVRIGTALYALSNILSSNQVVIYNDGGGYAEGFQVIAKDASGNYNYLLVSENSTDCSAADVDEARLVVCDGNVTKLLEGTIAGQVPVLQNSGSGVVRFQLLDAATRLCTTLSASFDVETGDTTYAIPVTSIANFSSGDILSLNFGALLFRVNTFSTGIINATTIGVVPFDQTFAAGTDVCRILSSDALIYNTGVDRISQTFADTTPVVLALDGSEATGSALTFLVTNTTNRSKTFLLTNSCLMKAVLDTTAGTNKPVINYIHESETVVGAIGTTAFTAYNVGQTDSVTGFYNSDDVYNADRQHGFGSSVVVLPGEEVRFRVRCRVVLVTASSCTLTVNRLESNTAGIGVNL